jgi:methyl-accepting chemotaxis protein
LANNKPAGATLNIFQRILLTMLGIALIPLAGLIYISGYQHQKDWRRNVDQNLELTANALGARVDGWLDGNLRALNQNARLPDILSMDTVRQQAPLKALQTTYEWSYLAFTVNSAGANIGRSDDKPLTQYGDRDYFKQVIGGRPVGQEVLIGRTTGQPALILAAPIAGVHSPVGGVIALAMHLTDVAHAVAGTRIGKTGYAILVDEHNKAVADGRPNQAGKALQDLSEHPALRAAPGQDLTIFEENGRQVVAFRRKVSLGWTLIVQQDYDEAFAALHNSRNAALTLSVAALLLVGLVSFLLARQLSRPVLALTHAAEEISRGRFATEITGTERKDELGALARAVERLSVSIRMAFERLNK